MSRPRKPFGANHPGRLPATMMKVLAAEMTDPSRLRRGKQYAKDGSVLDIVIDPGMATCEIQGSRSTPYIASVTVTPGDGMPLRRDVQFSCTCPDDDNWDGYACKHVVATLFAMSDEFLLEPELLDVWRNRLDDDAVGGPEGDADPDTDDADTDTDTDTDDADADGDDDVGEDSGIRVARHEVGRRGHLRLVGAGTSTGPPAQRADRPSHPPSHPPPDPLHDLLRRPASADFPDIGDIARVDPVLPRSRALADVLRDALGNLRIDWE